jgi:hypothetical protein
MDEILERLSTAEKQLNGVKNKVALRDLQKMIKNIDSVVNVSPHVGLANFNLSLGIPCIIRCGIRRLYLSGSFSGLHNRYTDFIVSHAIYI